MNQSVLKAYAPKARKDFIEAISSRAAFYGITKNKIEAVKIEGNVVIVGGKAFHSSIESKRQKLISRITKEGFDHVIDNIAYTWFNRFIAIRYMELHDYLDHGIRVLSNPESNDNSPEILEKIDRVNFRNFNKQKVLELKLDGTKDAEIYQMLIIAQCNVLSDSMPFLFENVDDESELLLPENLLHTDSLVKDLVKSIPEQEWQQVEILGWLYQYYISEKKDEVIGKVVKSEDIPAATQLFTPNWIVQYMVQNSLGAKWMATYPNSNLKDKMPYYIEPAKQTDEVVVKLKEITPTELNPEELTLLDPASGSGHILVEAYNLFKEIYIERGYRLKDIPKLILEKNLYGLDIDDRAAQLTALSVLMKARADDRNIFKTPLTLNLASIQETNGFDAGEMADLLFDSKADFTKEDVKKLIQLFENAKTFGSLITVPDDIKRKLPKFKELVTQPPKDMLASVVITKIKPIVMQAELLAKQYDAVVANPPYMGSQYLNLELKKFCKEGYEKAKQDLFAVFIDRFKKCMKQRGYFGFMTPFTWLTLSSYEDFRKGLIDEMVITSLIKPEYHSFFDSAFVPICCFSGLKGEVAGFMTEFYDLEPFYGADLQPIKLREGILNRTSDYIFKRKCADFLRIPSAPFAFSLHDSYLEAYSKKGLIGRDAKKGTTTGDNDQFLRLWWEVDGRKFSVNGGKKWFPMTKGGAYRKWYGNFETVINWENDGSEIRNFKDDNGKLRSRPQNLDFNFREGITWNDVTISSFSARYVPNNFVFNAVGPMIFGGELLYRIGMLNSVVNQKLLKTMCPTMKFEVGSISNIPVGSAANDYRIETAERCVMLSKQDWNSSELSWEFDSLDILRNTANSLTIREGFNQIVSKNKETIFELKRLEEQNNEYFIKFYNLGEVLNASVDINDITLNVNPYYRFGKNVDDDIVWLKHLKDLVLRLVTYSFGCMMGRYSLDHPGLTYANSGNEGFNPSLYKTFSADSDGIIPVSEHAWFEDDAASRFKEFVGVAWPKKHLPENLDFVAKALTDNKFDSAEEVIQKYFSNIFFKNHMQMYKKRPIYWLFSSGKNKAFQAIVYMHRYNEGTLSKMRTEYVIPLQGKINSRIAQLESDIASEKSGAHQKRLESEKEILIKQRVELQEFDEKLRHYADQRIKLDLDDGVKVNYKKFGDLLADAKTIIGGSED